MKIKGLIFDLDGVLVDTKKIHFDALNIALKSIKFEQISLIDFNPSNTKSILDVSIIFPSMIGQLKSTLNKTFLLINLFN